jgi:hypothetical protein
MELLCKVTMVRPKASAVQSSSRNRGKDVAESSRPTKRKVTRPPIIERESEEEVDEVMEDQPVVGNEDDSSEDEIDVDGLPKWKKTKQLSRFPEEIRPWLYKKKIGQSKQARHKLCMCERKVVRDEFDRFVVGAYFEKIGWEENMMFNNDDSDEVYVDQIVDWMATLKKSVGR